MTFGAASSQLTPGRLGRSYGYILISRGPETGSVAASPGQDKGTEEKR
jgi:hypothetical protein